VLHIQNDNRFVVNAITGEVKCLEIVNSKNEPIILSRREALLADVLTKHINALGYEIPITTLTAFAKKITEQRFYTVKGGISAFVPVVAGQGAWGTHITTYRTFYPADAFATGILNVGTGGGRMAEATTAVDTVTNVIRNWGKAVGWTLVDLEMASKSGNWDLISSLQKSRKQNFDLGIQAMAFLGLPGDPAVLGLLTQAANYNTAVIPMAIGSMTPEDLSQVPGAAVEAFRSNCNRTAYPNRFLLPESDYNTLANQASPTFPIKSRLQVLEESFKATCGNDFQIMASIYGDQAYSGFGYQQYALYKYDEETMRLDLPVPYSATLQNSTDNFNFQNVGYAQFTGLQLIRAPELLYFKY
jgi:hypothetical protein